MDSIFARTSIRQFTDKPVAPDQIDRLMKAAMAAPSAGNQQPWEFYLADDPAITEKLSECSPYAKPAKKAPLTIVPCMRSDDELRFPPCAPLDMSACAENILLEAASMGLGGVWMALYPDQDRVAKATEVLGCGNLRPFALIAVGHPAEDFPPRSESRYDTSRVHWLH